MEVHRQRGEQVSHLESARINAEYWEKAAREESDRATALQHLHQAVNAWKNAAYMAPIPMLMFCPRCREQHIDKPAPGWTNPPHATHTCGACGLLWRPSNHNTVGVGTVNALEPKHVERIHASYPGAHT